MTPKDGSDKTKQMAADVISEADEYFSAFTIGPKCPKCGSTLPGLLGSFTWGLVNGEGKCSCCGWPVRVCHRDGSFGFLNRILPYHPDAVEHNIDSSQPSIA